MEGLVFINCVPVTILMKKKLLFLLIRHFTRVFFDVLMF